MTDNPYQNIDISQNNPLNFRPEADLTPVKKAKIPLSPKVIILIVLATIVIFLFIASLIITSSRQKKSTPTPQSTPTPAGEIIPTASKSLVPEIYQEKFDNIEKNLKNDLDINPPSIDTEIGL